MARGEKKKVEPAGPPFCGLGGEARRGEGRLQGGGDLEGPGKGRAVFYEGGKGQGEVVGEVGTARGPLGQGGQEEGAPGRGPPEGFQDGGEEGRREDDASKEPVSQNQGRAGRGGQPVRLVEEGEPFQQFPEEIQHPPRRRAESFQPGLRPGRVQARRFQGPGDPLSAGLVQEKADQVGKRVGKGEEGLQEKGALPARGQGRPDQAHPEGVDPEFQVSRVGRNHGPAGDVRLLPGHRGQPHLPEGGQVLPPGPAEDFHLLAEGPLQAGPEQEFWIAGNTHDGPILSRGEQGGKREKGSRSGV